MRNTMQRTTHFLRLAGVWALLVAAFTIAAPPACLAQYPARPIRIIVTIPP
ncbi:MAG: hypothetical protein H6R21_2733, partial [Proteobacteria bacterium]|nr:hypothetical protein [Pseudomonadota bacterium]